MVTIMMGFGVVLLGYGQYFLLVVDVAVYCTDGRHQGFNEAF